MKFFRFWKSTLAVVMISGILSPSARCDDPAPPETVIPIPAAPVPVPRLDRLSALANYLDKHVKPGHFDIRQWGNTNDQDDPGYIGCAGGYAIKLFNDPDFYISKHSIVYVDRTRQSWRESEAIEHYFRMRPEDVEDIFSPKGYRYSENMHDPHYAAKKIRDLIKRERKGLAMNPPPRPTKRPIRRLARR